jgi:hypothetical protein
MLSIPSCLHRLKIVKEALEFPVVPSLKAPFGHFKGDSHIARRAHAVPMSCRAAKGSECVFPISFTQCGRVFYSHFPCRAHGML